MQLAAAHLEMGGQSNSLRKAGTQATKPLLFPRGSMGIVILMVSNTSPSSFEHHNPKISIFILSILKAIVSLYPIVNLIKLQAVANTSAVTEHYRLLNVKYLHIKSCFKLSKEKCGGAVYKLHKYVTSPYLIGFSS